MRKEDWDKLCRNIYEKECILLLGSEFPLLDTTTNPATTFAALLANRLKEELQSFDRVPAFIANHLDERELSQLACDYINYSGPDKKIARFDLETLVPDYLTEIETRVQSEYFEKPNILKESIKNLKTNKKKEQKNETEKRKKRNRKNRQKTYMGRPI